MGQYTPRASGFGSFALCFIFSFALVACGGGKSSSPSVSSPTATSEAAVSSNQSSAASFSSSSSSAITASSTSSATLSNASVSSASSSITSLTIHYRRPAADYAGWGLHLWGNALAANVQTTWTSPHGFDGVIANWNTAVIQVLDPSAAFNFIIHKGDTKSPAADLSFVPNQQGAEVWVVQDNASLFFTEAEANLALANIGNASATLDLSSVTPNDNNSGLPADWNKSASFMQIFVRSYKDSNGDGKGDLQGLISKLDYLKDLGITGIWLMPISKSSDHDHGYAVQDYRNLETDYGSLADLDMLISEAHKRGIGVILDYVMNHASSANPLFLDAASASDNTKRGWFIFNDTNPGWQAWGSPSWHSGATGFYYGVFGSGMPDFNLRNTEVVNYHINNLRFWMNRGIDGFRFDATGVLFENGSNAWSDQPDNHPLLAQVQAAINAYNNRFMICEAPDAPAQYALSSSCINAFAFGYQSAIKSSATNRSLNASLASLLNSSTKATMPLILGNHDSFAGNRPIGELSGNNLGDYKISAAITVLASSTSFTYYGEEIGMANGNMTDDGKLRTPMSWTNNTVNAGFSSATPYRSLSTNLASFNVAAETGVEGSLLEHYRQLYQVRKALPILGTGNLSLKSAAGNSHLVFTRTQGNKVAAVLINLSLSAQILSVNVGLNNTGFTQQLPATQTNFTSNSSGTISVTLPAQGVVVLAN